MAIDPTTPSSFCSGTITVPAGVSSLYALIRAQIDQHCPGSATELQIQTDASGDVYFGTPNLLGPTSLTNYGFWLAAGSPGDSRTYRSSGVERSPLSNLQVFNNTGGNVTIHVDVTA